MREDELLDRLADALHEAPTDPPADRIAALRAAAEARRATPAPPAGADAPVTAMRPRRERPAPTRWYVAAAAAVVLVLGGIAVLGSGDDGPAGEVEYAGPIVGDVGAADLRVVKTGIGRVIEIDTADLEILPTGEYYEVWFVGPGDEPETPNRISAGTFHPRPDGVTDVTLAAAVDPAKYPVVVVTAEPGDGDPTPSGDVRLRTVIAG